MPFDFNSSATRTWQQQHVGLTADVCPDFQARALRPTSALLHFVRVGLGGVGWGWVGLGGVGWGWVGGAGTIPNLSFVTVHDLHLHLMLRCMIFTCT